MTQDGISGAAGQRRTLGLVGGMSWEATALYYRLINEAVAARLGGHHNARSVLVTVDFEDMLAPGLSGDWDAAAGPIVDAARAVERAGGECILLTANTAHLVADRVAAACRAPLIHIADAVGADARRAGFARLGLIGTRQTVGSGLYDRVMAERFGIAVDLPRPAEQDDLQSIILDELTRGEIRAASRTRCLDIVARMAAAGADGIIVGCTELPLLLAGHRASAPLLDTTRLHVARAIDFAFATAV